ncbi:MAG: DUF4229 domain-containing protein [Mycobacteriales bacterium]|nr:MAG: DUF4229 domain-containing protein [Pseudonocardiales bacterium]
MRAALVYTVARFGVFAILGGIGYLAGLRGLLLVFLALVVSLPVSFVLLRRHRAAMVQDTTSWWQNRRENRGRVRNALRDDDADDARDDC